MNIFLPVFDLYLKQGGGETIYQQIISTMKDHRFYYLTLDEPKTTRRPANAVAVPFNYHYSAAPFYHHMPYFLYECFLVSMNMARSVAENCPGVVFDAVDTPDYNQNGIFIGHALKHHKIKYGSVILSLHGNVSTSIKYNWQSKDSAMVKQLSKLRVLESLQYQVVDHRYAISTKYAANWKKKYPSLSCRIIDPLVFLNIPTEFAEFDSNTKPDIYCICRKERLKGPDVFIDLAWFVPRHLYNNAILVGPEDNAGNGSEKNLAKAAQLRGYTVINMPAQKRSNILAFFNQKAINVVPSRYESLSLSALESLLNGCPTVISNRCGVIDYLKTEHPQIPFYEIDITCDRDGARTIQYVIENYDQERAKLINAIKALPAIDKVAAITGIYSITKSKDTREETSQLVNRLFSQFLYISESHKKTLAYSIKSAIQKNASLHLRTIAIKVLGKGFNKLQKMRWYFKNTRPSKANMEKTIKRVARLFLNDPKSIAQLYFAASSNHVKHRLHYREPEKSLKEIKSKIQKMEEITWSRYTDRIRYFYELSILESRRNNDLISAVYKARILRWQKKDFYSDVEHVAYILGQQGYHREVETFLAIHSPDSTYESQLALLNKKLEHNKHKDDMPFEFIDDRRAKKNYKISVIVSLYKAASKFPTFIRMLEQQTMINQDEVEVVFIDSGSPTDEYSIIREYTGKLKNSFVYARSENRETIQCAWNRGIKLSSGKYLTFQAADEAIHPECLEVLSKELDEDPSVDWIMGNAIVAEIDKDECLFNDIMSYKRDNAKNHSHILDCTYVNYTPGLYRKSVHEKYGFYDETFSAAGDTEFKNRVLPFINIKYIPRVLGAYNNYQEERTTQHPRAEIEDMRAWYIFRTPAGIAYLFQNKSEEDLLDLLKDTMGYRKSFCGHISTDIELGLSVSIYLYKKTGKEKYKLLENEYRSLVNSCNNIELFNANSSPIRILLRETRRFKNTKKKIGDMLGMPKVEFTAMFHDNRYEQHWWPWSTKN